MPDNILLEFDKSGAEWVCVAYLSGDANMLDVIRNKKRPHAVTGSLISGAPEDLVLRDHKLVGHATDPDEVLRLRQPLLAELGPNPYFWPRSMSIYQAGKKSNHGLNYGMKYRRFALENELQEADALTMVRAYNETAYPGVPEWQSANIEELRKNNRTLTNCFGRKVRLLGEWGPDLWMAAHSFRPQSTIVDMVNEGLCRAYEDTSSLFAPMDLLEQKHDSITAQYPWSDIAQLFTFSQAFATYMSPPLTYNGQAFNIDTELKLGFNRGDMVELGLMQTVTEARMAEAIERCHASVRNSNT